MQEIWLKSLSIEGLHKGIDLHTEFHPGINVIYGKNGVGKTTMLHMLSNFGNMDFERFKNVDFESFRLKISNGTTFYLAKVKGDQLSLSINDRNVKIGPSHEISKPHQEIFAKTFGKRPLYVPAFRSVLQKMDERHGDEVRLINTRSHSYWREKAFSQYRREGSNLKTQQCRAWFGEFTPEIHYPSVEEAESDLEQYWLRANSASRHEEAKLVTEATNKILAGLLGSEPEEVKSVIDSIMVEAPEGARLSSTLARNFVHSFQNDNGVVSSSVSAEPKDLAEIYVRALIEAKHRSRGMFSRFNSFVESMDSFLDPDRSLEIGAQYSGSPSLKISFNYDHKRSYGVSGLSSGERQLFTLLYASWRAKGESTFMLIDEPEISLHIDWQRQILPEMYKQGQQQVIACTHSPEVAADLDQGYQVFDRFSRNRADGGINK